MSEYDPMESAMRRADVAQESAADEYARMTDEAGNRQAAAWPYLARFVTSMKAAGKRHSVPLLVCRGAQDRYVGVTRGWLLDDHLAVTVDGWLVYLADIQVKERLRRESITGRFYLVDSPRVSLPMPDAYLHTATPAQQWADQLGERLGHKLHELQIPLADAADVPAAPPPTVRMTRAVSYSHVHGLRRALTIVMRMVAIFVALGWVMAACSPDVYVNGRTSPDPFPALGRGISFVLGLTLVTTIWKARRPVKTLTRKFVVYLPSRVCHHCGRVNDAYGWRLCTDCRRVLRG